MYGLTTAMTISLVFFIASALPAGLFVYAILRQTKGKFKNNTELICFLLVVLQFFFYFGLGVANVFATINPFGFSDPGLCLGQAIIIMLGTGGFFGLHASLALERLRIMVTGRPMGSWMIFFAFLTYFLGWFLIFVVQFAVAETPLQLWGSGAVCYLVMFSANEYNKIGTRLIIVYSVIWVGTMVLCYGYVLYVVLKTTNDVKTLNNNAKSVALQRMQLFRCVLILLVTVLSYLPNILCIFFELVLDAQIPDILHDIALYVQELDGFFTVMVLLYVNTQNWDAFKKYILGIPVLDPKSSTTSKNAAPKSNSDP